MTATPAPSPAEQDVIDRFGIFEPEEQVEKVARAMAEDVSAGAVFEDPQAYAEDRDFYRRLAAVAIAAMPAPLAGQRTTDEETDR